MKVPGHRVVVRRDRRGARRHRRRRVAAAGRARACTARSRCTGPTAAWCRSWRRATTSAASLPLARAGAGARPAAGWTSSTSSPTRAGRGWPARCWSAPAWPCALAAALDKPVLGVHHLEGHLLSPFLSADPPQFPFVALLVSGGHTQLMRVDGVGRYELLGETIDDAAGEAFDKTRQAAGPGLSRRAGAGAAGRAGRCRRLSSCRGRCCTAATSTSRSPA